MKIKTAISRLKHRFIVDSIGSFYSSSDYTLVIKYVGKPFSQRRKDEALCNIFRILSLRKLNQDQWEKEFEYFIDKSFLDLFNPDEREYLTQILHLELFGEYNLSTERQVNVQNLSNAIRSYLPRI